MKREQVLHNRVVCKARICFLLFIAMMMVPRSVQSQAPDQPQQLKTHPSNPTILSAARLTLPGVAEVAGVEGAVTVRALIGKNGKAIKTEIVHREPEFAFIFDEDARAFAMNSTFSPATDSLGNPRSAWVTLPLNFTLTDFEPPVLTELGAAEYPEEAVQLGIEGWVGLAVVVNEMGFVAREVDPVILARKDPLVTLFDRAAIDAARRSRFTPGKGKLGPQRGWAFVKINFTIPE